MSDQIRENINSILAQESVTFSAVLLGETVKDNNWKCDEWRITLKHDGKEFTTAYYTGTRLRKPKRSVWPKPNCNPNSLMMEAWKRDSLKPVAPHVADVLHSLILDASTGNECFNDWCDNLGYDSDSMKAFKTYQACCDTAKLLRKVFNSHTIAALAEILQDY
jgi:hypothetical protein